MPRDAPAFSRAPLTITVAGTRFRVPYRPAGHWLVGLGHLSSLAGTLADPGDRERLAELIIDDPLAGAGLREESLRVLAEQTGWNWWEAGRLMATSQQPDVLGRLVLAGVDAYARSIGEWCAAVYAVCVKGQDEKGRVKFDFSLALPPAGYEDAWDDKGDDPEATMRAVQGMMGNG